MLNCCSIHLFQIQRISWSISIAPRQLLSISRLTCATMTEECICIGVSLCIMLGRCVYICLLYCESGMQRLRRRRLPTECDEWHGGSYSCPPQPCLHAPHFVTIPLKYAAGDLLYMLPQEPALSLSYDLGEGLLETGRIRDVFNLKFEKMYNALSRLSLRFDSIAEIYRCPRPSTSSANANRFARGLQVGVTQWGGMVALEMQGRDSTTNEGRFAGVQACIARANSSMSVLSGGKRWMRLPGSSMLPMQSPSSWPSFVRGERLPVEVSPS